MLKLVLQLLVVGMPCCVMDQPRCCVANLKHRDIVGVFGCQHSVFQLLSLDIVWVSIHSVSTEVVDVRWLAEYCGGAISHVF